MLKCNHYKSSIAQEEEREGADIQDNSTRHTDVLLELEGLQENSDGRPPPPEDKQPAYQSPVQNRLTAQDAEETQVVNKIPTVVLGSHIEGLDHAGIHALAVIDRVTERGFWKEFSYSVIR